MNVVHFLPEVRIELGGVARAVLDMSTRLASAGHRVTLLTWDDTDIPAAWKAPTPPPGVPRSIRLTKGPLRTLGGASLREASRWIAGASVLHLHNPWEPANLQLARAARRDGVPYVLSVHGMLDDWSMAQSRTKKRVFLAIGGRSLLRRAAAIHCTAEAELAQARKWFDPTPGVVVPLILDLEPFTNLPGPELARATLLQGLGQAPLVLFLSRIHPKKGAETLIRALAQVHAAGRTCQLALAGTGEDAYLASLRTLVEQLGLDDAVRFVGLVRGSEKQSLYQAASVFALPTHQENFGLVFPESLACGTPVVTTRGVDIWPELQSSGGALIVDNTPEAFAAALGTLLADPDRARAMGQAGQQWVLRELAPDRTTQRLADLYASLATPRKGDNTTHR